MWFELAETFAGAVVGMDLDGDEGLEVACPAVDGALDVGRYGHDIDGRGVFVFWTYTQTEFGFVGKPQLLILNQKKKKEIQWESQETFFVERGCSFSAMTVVS